MGLDGYHLSFFEMMGNSIGQYFKEGAVELAWEFLFERLKIDEDRLWVSVRRRRRPRARGGRGRDRGLGQGVGLPRERIVGLPRAEKSPGKPVRLARAGRARDAATTAARSSRAAARRGPGCPCERYLEFWNLVFMEFDLHEDGTLHRCFKPVIDTGSGWSEPRRSSRA